jgi:hypothetical protein
VEVEVIESRPLVVLTLFSMVRVIWSSTVSGEAPG